MSSNIPKVEDRRANNDKVYIVTDVSIHSPCVGIIVGVFSSKEKAQDVRKNWENRFKQDSSLNKVAILEMCLDDYTF